MPTSLDAEPRPRTRFHLAIFDDCLRSLPIHDGTMLIGRSKRSHLQLADALLSRKHCSLTAAGSVLTLVDLSSSNGTYVNGSRIGSRTLACDDIIELGKTVLVVFDGTAWTRGSGLLNLRNPLKAQELVQRIRDGAAASLPRGRPAAQPAPPGVREVKGLTENERAFLRSLEGAEALLPELLAAYMTHKLASLVVRNSRVARDAFSAVMQEIMSPEFLAKVRGREEMYVAIRDLLREEIAEIIGDEQRKDGAAAGNGENLLEVEPD
ncbi:MAG: FHA domain-containing protein [Planctomycetes bacterium]|nr:FHA domain-containing protein [Planctomycetota bacterium]